ncbi:hypothetical protein BDSB_08090 [Burkholderia dolosa PC543]|nr:hypothetical protein BDSB_08090 [Burkholderia dolosa PC543]
MAVALTGRHACPRFGYRDRYRLRRIDWSHLRAGTRHTTPNVSRL